MDLLLGAETGNCAFAVLPAANERTLLLELIFVLEAIAAPRLHADRFLPLTPVRLVVSHKLEDVSRTFCGTNLGTEASERLTLQTDRKCRNRQPDTPRHVPDRRESGRGQGRSTAPVGPERNEPPARPRGGAPANARAGERSRSSSRKSGWRKPSRRNWRLRLQQSRLRLDSLRLIWKGPPEALS